MRRSYMIEVIFNLLLIVLFVGCSFVILLLGASSYQRNTFANDRLEQLRLPLSYLTTKIHQSNGYAMEIMDIDHTEVLVIEEMIDQQSFCTAIYCYQGQLMELFAKKDQLDLTLGTPISALSSLDITLTDNSVNFDVCVNDQCNGLTLHR